MLKANGPSFDFSLAYQATLGLADLCVLGGLSVSQSANHKQGHAAGRFQDICLISRLGATATARGHAGALRALPKSNGSAILSFGLFAWPTAPGSQELRMRGGAH